jgi:hypothetical protein
MQTRRDTDCDKTQALFSQFLAIGAFTANADGI